ncbi:siderophore ABC transporter substrate-binding protein [Paenibacillaceae bacterium]|nr:siderophore ABC transporter substrate-binding protein [Paenibacillaceae bacterium]
MKKPGLILMSLLLVLLIAACGAKNTETGGGTSNNQSAAGGSGAQAGEDAKGQEEENKQESEESTEEQNAEGTSSTITVTHQLGETQVSVNPQKVVVFDFGVLDSLNKLGVEVTGVPQANIPPYLKQYEDSKYQNVGSLKEPDFEKISEIAPDLIIISGRQSDSYDELTKLGPTIYLGVDSANYMASYTSNAEILGQIFNKETEVAAELADVKQAIEALHGKVTSKGSNALIILANDGNVSAYGAGSRFGIIHDVFGFTPADENIEVSTHGMSISFEYIVEKDPEYLFVVDRGAVVGGESSAKQVIENDLVNKTKAYKEGNIVYLDPNYWYLSGGGLISVAEMVREITESIE